MRMPHESFCGQQRVDSAYRGLINQRLNLLTTDYVFDETVTFLQKQYGTAVAKQCGEAILSAPYIKLLFVDNEIWQAAWEMFQSYEDKQFTDCTSFIVMQRQQVWQAFSFDQNFEQAGFQMWPGVGG